MTPSRRAALLLALLLDVALGDPPNQFHPVAWMGRGIAALKRGAPAGDPARFLYGGLMAGGGACLIAGLGRIVERGAGHLARPARFLLLALLLKSTFSLRRLLEAALAVERALAAGDLEGARKLLAWQLVSRDTSTLTPPLVAAATIESVAENLSDGLVGPLLFYATGGLPGALLYRFINTMDSMLGYRDATHEWLGKVSARLDDAANFLPARLTALLLVLAAALAGEDARGAWRVWRRDRTRTASPNAGHPMAAMAGALGVELEKVGHYRLGAGQRAPEARDIRRAARLTGACATLFASLLVGLPLPRSARTDASHAPS